MIDIPIFWIRVVYLALSLFVAWGCVRQLYGACVPPAWFAAVLSFALIVMLYQGYHLILSCKSKKKQRKHKK